MPLATSPKIRANTSTLGKNPLAWALGMALQRARREAQPPLTSKQLADGLGLSGSLLRLIESGSANLQPTKALALIRSLPDARIEFGPLVTMLAAIQIVETGSKSVEAMHDLAAEAASASPQLGVLLRRFTPVWDAMRRGAAQQELARILNDGGLPGSVLEFLAEPQIERQTEFPTTAKEWGGHLMSTVPPLMLEFVENYLSDMHSFTPKLNFKQVAKWEKRHGGRLRFADVVVTSADILVETFNQFEWSPLVGLEHLRVVSLAPEESAADEGKKLKMFRSLFAAATKLYEGAIELRLSHEVPGATEDFTSMLLFDVVENRCVRTLGHMHKKHVHTFLNAWIYRVKPKQDSQDSKTSPGDYNLVLMDDRAANVDKPPASAKKGALGKKAMSVEDEAQEGAFRWDCMTIGWEDTNEWVQLLEGFWNTPRTQ